MEKLQLDINIPVRSFDVDVTLGLGPGVFALAGPSGAGKSTILRAIAGLTRPQSGRITLGETVWFDCSTRTNLEPQERSAGFVFQDYALFPHLTVAQNVAFGADKSVTELLCRFKIESLADVKPAFLSGGEKQRVALARALACSPRVLLMDEPLAALDMYTRESVRIELAKLLREIALPTVLVSHDFEDAAVLADQVGILSNGRIIQVGSPAELVADPQTAFVASFTGNNLVHGEVVRVVDDMTEVLLENNDRILVKGIGSGKLGVVIPPWKVSLGGGRATNQLNNELEVTVVSVVPQGNHLRIVTDLLAIEILIEDASCVDLASGSKILVSFDPEVARFVSLVEL